MGLKELKPGWVERGDVQVPNAFCQRKHDKPGRKLESCSSGYRSLETNHIRHPVIRDPLITGTLTGKAKQVWYTLKASSTSIPVKSSACTKYL